MWPKRGNSPARKEDAVEAVLDSMKTKHIADLRVCAVNICGSSFPNEGEESAHVAPELVARTLSTPIFGARSGLLLDPEHVRIGRQTEPDSLHRHRVIEEVPNGHEETHVQGGWTKDYKKFPFCRSRFVAEQLTSSACDDVTQSTPALLGFSD